MGHEAVHASGWTAHFATAPDDARGAGVSRSGTAHGESDTRRGVARAERRCRAVGRHGQPGGGALHVPQSRTGVLLFLRLLETNGIARRNGEADGTEIQRAAIPRFHPFARLVAASTIEERRA